MGNGVTVTNHFVNFGLGVRTPLHLLGHEEMDMMHAPGLCGRAGGTY